MPVIDPGPALRGIDLPGSTGLYSAILLGLALLAGVGVIAYNCYQDRARALSQRGRTVLSRPVVVVTNAIALTLVANALISSLGKLLCM